MARIQPKLTPALLISNARVFFGGLAGLAASASARVGYSLRGSSSLPVSVACAAVAWVPVAWVFWSAIVVPLVRAAVGGFRAGTPRPVVVQPPPSRVIIVFL